MNPSLESKRYYPDPYSELAYIIGSTSNGHREVLEILHTGTHILSFLADSTRSQLRRAGIINLDQLLCILAGDKLLKVKGVGLKSEAELKIWHQKLLEDLDEVQRARLLERMNDYQEFWRLGIKDNVRFKLISRGITTKTDFDQLSNISLY